jgi:hypothetical protein
MRRRAGLAGESKALPCFTQSQALKIVASYGELLFGREQCDQLHGAPLSRADERFPILAFLFRCHSCFSVLAAFLWLCAVYARVMPSLRLLASS